MLTATFLVTILTFAPPVSTASPADAPEKAPAFAEEIVVTATAAESRDHDLPYGVEVLGGDEIRLRQAARTLPEALDELSGVMVQKTAHGQGSPFLRGFTGFRTLLLVDGIRLNNSVFRDGPNQYWATVDPLALERLEVVKGPVSVLYGSDAIGGTVNAITLSPRDPAAGHDLGGRLYYRFASAEASHVGRLDLDGRAGGRFRYHLGGSFKSFGELEAGGEVGRQPKTDYDEWDGDFKGTYDLDAGRRLAVGWQRTRLDDAWRTHRTVFGVPWHGTTVGDERRRSLDQDRWLGFVRFRQEARTALFDRLEASLSYHRQEEERLRVRGDGRSDRQGFDVATTGVELRFGKALGRGRLSYGAELYHDEVGSFSRRFRADGSFDRDEVQGPVADGARYDLGGLYAQHELPVGRRLTLLAGARYERAEATARRVVDPTSPRGDRGGESQSGGVTSTRGRWDEVVGNLRALVRLGGGDRWHLFGGVSQGFRAPNLSDLTRFDSARSDEIETPSPDLEPERFLAYELGVKTRWSGGAAELTGFYTDVDGLIVRVPTGRRIDGDAEVTKRNAGDGYVRGVEASVRVRLARRLSVSGAFTWMDGEVDTYPTSAPVRVREPLDRLMPPTGHLGLRYDLDARDGWIELAWTVADRQDRLSTRDRADTQRIPPGGTPGYEVLTLRGGLSPRHGLRLSAALGNLTDEAYRVHGSGLNQAGRNLVLAVELDF